MAALMKNWLGPEIETNLRYAVEYKRFRIKNPAAKGPESGSKPESQNEVREAVSKHLGQKRYKCTYKDNGSSLSAAIEFLEPKDCIVQLSEVCAIFLHWQLTTNALSV
jgi:hypothetical protein